METSDIFYCIKVIRHDGTRGWVADTKNGLTIVIGGVNTDITQFQTEQEANKFIKERKLERNGIKAYVRTNQEMIQDAKKVETRGMSPMTKPTYYIENQKGEKCYYDSREEVYFFKRVEAGYPCWFDEQSVRKFVKDMKFEQPMIFMIKHYNSEKKKTLIQIYGQKKRPDGTFSEPEYTDIEGDNYETQN